MNLNNDMYTYIKQEFLNSEDELKTTLPVSDSNIPVKNEPISDETFSFVTIKKERLTEETLMNGEGFNIKNEEQFQNQVTIPGDSFIIYELEAPFPNQIQHEHNLLDNKQILKEAGQLASQANAVVASITPIDKLATNSNKAIVSQSQQIAVKHNVPNSVTSPVVTSSPPILLNAQLRKRNKMVIPVNPIDKRTRYNIEGATAPLKMPTTYPIKPLETLNGCHSLNTGGKRIINHLIKHKRNQRKLENNTIIDSSLSKDTSSSDESNKLQIDKTPINMNTEESSMTFGTSKTTTQTDITTHLNKSNLCSSNPAISTPTIPKELKISKDYTNTSELRVKCLCSLTTDAGGNSTNNSDLKDFFKEMFEETRRLTKKQQRKIKLTLLQAISDAEESLEHGKCCSF